MPDEVVTAPETTELPASDWTVEGNVTLDSSKADKPAASPREALERALAKVDGGQTAAPAAPAATAAKSEPAPDADGRLRGPDGKFAAKDGAIAAPGTPEPPKPTRQPPQRFNKAAQEAWGQAPEVVQAEIDRAIQELTAGIDKHKPGSEAYEAIKRYDEMARQSGTTLDKALEAYTNIEQAWVRNPAHGFVAVCQNLGVAPGAMLQHIAQALNGSPQFQQGDTPEVAALKGQITALEQKLNGFGSTLSQRNAETVIDRFIAERDANGAPAHPYFEDLADSIAHMLETGFAKDLSDAYAKAVRLNPEVAAKIAKDNEPKPDLAAQTQKKAALQITGSPHPGSNPASKPAGSAREAVQNALAQVGLH